MNAAAAYRKLSEPNTHVSSISFGLGRDFGTIPEAEAYIAANRVLPLEGHAVQGFTGRRYVTFKIPPDLAKNVRDYINYRFVRTESTVILKLANPAVQVSVPMKWSGEKITDGRVVVEFMTGSKPTIGISPK